ncbi:hypothetical protein D3C86_2091190 [compost metagenome]
MQVIKKRFILFDFPLGDFFHFDNDITQDFIEQLLLIREKGINRSFSNIRNLGDLIHCSCLIAK